MFKEERIADGRSEIMLETLLCQLLLLCGRECHFVNDLPDDIHTTDRQIVAAAKFISERYMDDITAADIACAAGYSPNYLSKNSAKRRARACTNTCCSRGCSAPPSNSS